MRGAHVLAIGLLGVTAAAQSPQFDVVSVKENKTGGMSMAGFPSPGRMAMTNSSIVQLIQIGYRVQPFQLAGVPDWLRDTRYDITAVGPPPKMAPGANGLPEEWLSMIKGLLADRFKLVVHTETRQLPVYEMAIVRRDGTLGPKLQKSAIDCATSPECGIGAGAGRMSGKGMPLSQIAATLSFQVGRTVLDRTQISGIYDFEITYTPERFQRQPGAPAPAQPVLVNGQAIDPDGPSIFTALQEQLGLRLEAGNGPVEALVIDSVERPTAD